MKPIQLLFAFTFILFSAVCCLASDLYVDLNSTNPVPPFSNWATAAANIQDAVDAAVDGDRIFVNDGVYNSGSSVVYGATNRVAVSKAVAIQSVNGPVATIIDGTATMRCVYLTNNASLIGFTLTNGVAIFGTDPVKQLSGGGAWCEPTNSLLINCVIVSNKATKYGGGVFGGFVSNSTVTYNTASGAGASGGGVASNAVQNCILMRNSALLGGGAHGAVLVGCIIVSNTFFGGGGGAYASALTNCFIGQNIYGGPFGATGAGGVQHCLLYNCTVCGNMSYGVQICFLYNCTVCSNNGTGSLSSTNYNCILYHNPNNYDFSKLTNCCTFPLAAGSGNFTNAPLFVNEGAGDFHLQSNSPCINAGRNSFVATATDLDGNLRIAGGTVDVGAYEYQTPASVISYAWLQQYGLPTDGSVDFADLDGTGMSDYQKWIAGLSPTNAASVLAMLTPTTDTNSGDVIVSWESVSNRTYYLQRATNLAMQPAFSAIQSNITGSLTGTNSYTDPNSAGWGPYFYRVGVQQ
jgi:hypothetical protein